MIGAEDVAAGVDVVTGVEIAGCGLFHDGAGDDVDGVLFGEILEHFLCSIVGIELGEVAED